MNREIKFRGFSSELNKWVYGSLVYQHTGTSNYSEIGPYISIVHSNSSGTVILTYEVIPESIGQYTGFKDLKGNDWYEGDVIEMKQGIQGKRDQAFVCRGLIHFYYGSFYIRCIQGLFSNIYLHEIDGIFEVRRCWHGHLNRQNLYEECFDIVRVGNNQDNPELLTQEK